MRTGLVVSLVAIAAIASFFGINGVFGLLPAIATLLLFVALACVLNVRPRSFEHGQ